MSGQARETLSRNVIPRQIPVLNASWVPSIRVRFFLEPAGEELSFTHNVPSQLVLEAATALLPGLYEAGPGDIKTNTEAT